MTDSSNHDVRRRAALAFAALIASVLLMAGPSPANAQSAAPGACVQGMADAVAEIATATIEDTEGLKVADAELDKAMAARDIGAWVVCADSVAKALFAIGMVDEATAVAMAADDTRRDACNAAIAGVRGVLDREPIEDIAAITKAESEIDEATEARVGRDWPACMGAIREAFEAIGYYEAAAATVVR
ncbi:MAG: hypothetical protein O2905_05580 [Proteobacteria bacterium]|nr:hypothetical protein [Pseudomonadota bacterium]